MVFSHGLSYLHEQLPPRCQERRVLLDSGAPRFDSASLIWQQEPLYRTWRAGREMSSSFPKICMEGKSHPVYSFAVFVQLSQISSLQLSTQHVSSL